MKKKIWIEFGIRVLILAGIMVFYYFSSKHRAKTADETIHDTEISTQISPAEPSAKASEAPKAVN